MQIKTITGASIHAALAEARRLLGDDVVLLESVPSSGSEPARITIMVDAAASQEASPPAPAPRRAVEESASYAPPGYGYGAAKRQGGRDRSPEESARSIESFSPTGDGAVQALPASTILHDGPHRTDDPSSFRPPPPTGKPGRGRLFPDSGEAMRPSAPLPVHAATSRLEQMLEAQLTRLHERLEAMERRLDGAVVGASQRWVAHPLFAALLGQGLRPGTIISLFDSLVEKGYAPDEEEEKLKWALAHEVRGRMAVPASKQSTGTQVVIGPSGVGKTSLVLKLATHPNFYARHHTTVIVIAPEEAEATSYQNPVEVYRRFGVPVQSVQTQDEMEQALTRLVSFDQVLIDTPSMPVHAGRARKMLQRIRRLVDGLMPLEVVFVLNTTRVLEGFDVDFVRRLPLRPTTVALTHLDETPGWGRIAEWLMHLKLPVRLASMGPGIPDDLSAFSPTWFVEKMMELE